MCRSGVQWVANNSLLLTLLVMRGGEEREGDPGVTEMQVML